MGSCAQLIMHSINDACLIARVTFEDTLEVHRLWRYLNMLHAAAYCGLTEELSETNFLMPLCEKYGLLSFSKVREEEYAELKAINIDQSGSRACAMLEVWAFEVVKGEAVRYERASASQRKSALAPPIHAKLQSEINNISISIKRLFAYRYQVLPYIYTHLVSLSCALYLVCFSFLMGTRFSPEASISFGVVYPALYVVVQIVTTLGLIEVGETILDPFGSDPEDYALLHFVEVTVVSSHEAIQIKPCGVRVKDREDFYNHKELFAANKIIKRLVANHRFHKMVQQAKLQAEFRETIKKSQAGLDASTKNKKGGKTLAPDNSAKLPAGTSLDAQKRRKHRRRSTDYSRTERPNSRSENSFKSEHPGRVARGCGGGEDGGSPGSSPGATASERISFSPTPAPTTTVVFKPVSTNQAGRTHSHSRSSPSRRGPGSPRLKQTDVQDLKDVKDLSA